jgi:hypothetical protein
MRINFVTLPILGCALQNEQNTFVHDISYENFRTLSSGCVKNWDFAHASGK